MTNNCPYVSRTSFIGAARDNITPTATQYENCINTSITQRQRYLDTTANSTSGIFGLTAATITSLSQIINDYTPTHTYQVLNTHYVCWTDYAVIKLSSIFESLSSIGLTQKADIFLRLYVNTGTFNVSVSNPATATPGYSLTTANNTFNPTCPFTVNYLPDTGAQGGVPTTSANITAGLYLAKPPSTTFNGVNLSTSGYSHYLPACRIYYSLITLQPAKATEYVDNNRAKKCIYRTVLTNQYNNIGSAANFNQLISSGIIHPTGILIVPYVSSLAPFSFGDFAWKSPFDCCPGDAHPLS
jgi:hypothetical protein